MTGAGAASPFKQPKAVFAVAFACVVSFMGIGLVDPILPAISHDLNATPSQVTLLFTSYLVITAVAMLITGWVSSRIGAKKTLIAGLALIVVFSALAGTSDRSRASSASGPAGAWATPCSSRPRSRSSWRRRPAGSSARSSCTRPRWGSASRSARCSAACSATSAGAARSSAWPCSWPSRCSRPSMLVEPLPRPDHRTSILEPLRALRHRGLALMSLTALCYNWAFFTVLGYAPFPMGLGAIELGLVFTGWGVLVAIFSVFGAPWLQARFGIARTLYLNLFLFALTVLVIAIWTTTPAVLIVCVIVAGVFIGVNNTVTTQAVMTVSPVERPVASAAYGFVRFIGGGLAPFAAGKLVEATNIHVPFFIGAGTLLVGILILRSARAELAHAERVQAQSVAAPPADAPSLSTVELDTGAAASTERPIVAAIDDSPTAHQVAGTAGRLAAVNGRAVHVLHVQEQVSTTEAAAGGEALAAARELVRTHLKRLAADGVPVVGHVLRNAGDHGAAGRAISEYANEIGARAVVIGAPTHGGLPALMDASASREIWRTVHCDVLIVNPAAVLAGAAAG